MNPFDISPFICNNNDISTVSHSFEKLACHKGIKFHDLFLTISYPQTFLSRHMLLVSDNRTFDHVAACPINSHPHHSHYPLGPNALKAVHQSSDDQ